MTRMRSQEQKTLHDEMVSLRQKGLTVIEIGQRVFRCHSTVSYHLDNNCQCGGPEYVYVAASWFKCRLCGGGWFDRNGCRHSWELTV